MTKTTTTKTTSTSTASTSTSACRRCAATDHQLGECTQACVACHRTESWCTAEKCTAKCQTCEGNHLTHRCDSAVASAGAKGQNCRRCGATDHMLRECTVKCVSCHRTESWCTTEKCTAKCRTCEGNHLTQRCDSAMHAQTQTCRRCNVSGHALQECTQPCQNCRRTESWCTTEKCTAKCTNCSGNHMSRQCLQCRKCAEFGHDAKNCTSEDAKCLRCQQKGHSLKECRVKCTVCGDYRQWCTGERCQTRCQRCRGAHLTEKCTQFEVVLKLNGKYEMVEIQKSLPNPTIVTDVDFPTLR